MSFGFAAGYEKYPLEICNTDRIASVDINDSAYSVKVTVFLKRKVALRMEDRRFIFPKA